MISGLVIYITFALVTGVANIYEVRATKSVLDNEALHAYTVNVLIDEFANFFFGVLLVSLSLYTLSGILQYVALIVAILIAKVIGANFSNLYLKNVYHKLELENRKKALGGDTDH